jgi:hypothetical protein
MMKVLFFFSLLSLTTGLVEDWVSVEEPLLGYLDSLVTNCAAGAANHGKFVVCVGKDCGDDVGTLSLELNVTVGNSTNTTEVEVELEKTTCQTLKNKAAQSKMKNVQG